MTESLLASAGPAWSFSVEAAVSQAVVCHYDHQAELFIQTPAGAKNFLKTLFLKPCGAKNFLKTLFLKAVWRGKLFQMKV